MIKTTRRTGLSLLLFISFISSHRNLFSQVDACAPVGWVTQNGGVTGGGSAAATVVTNYADLKTAITSTSIKVVHISGDIEIPSGGRISFQNQSAKTIIGLPGSSLYSNDLTEANSGILYVKRCSNIIFRNVTLIGPGAYDTDGSDNMTIDNCTNIWVDHCEFYDGLDGNLDIKNAADYISVTWTKFGYLKPPIAGGPGGSNDHRFSDLIGSSDSETQSSGKLKITFQYCWWSEGCVERMPRVRFGQLHIVNNLYNSTVSKYCILAGYEADLLIENNAFINVKTPIDISQGTHTGVTARNNIFSGTTGNTSGSGTSFTPPYSLSIANASVLNTNTFKNCVGATLSAPAALACPCSSALPVDIIWLDVQARAEDYLVSWTLAGIQELRYSVLEVSADGKNFMPVVSLLPHKTSYIIREDEWPSDVPLYVRLKLVENDNSHYSQVKFSAPLSAITLYPNPAKDMLYIRGANGYTKVILYTVDGKKIHEEVSTEADAINVGKIPAGSYVAEIISSNEVRRVHFFKTEE